MTEALLINLGQFDDSSIPALSATTHDVEALQELLLAGANSIFTGAKLLTAPNPERSHDEELIIDRLGMIPKPL
ncbi:hypothetical protein [Leptolyngbya sp. NIES-2104]|uniref:hypothetical protein n=1 Tax=Leptolyngbya sp. NIES-2104 TaxID=1552121 RepID=UPI0006EC4D98|nr:hypothetical protein [Leptolyngbya sp. NIES-2104]GAP98324.1 biotin synthase [Leptolyngbya sp. NIES-2104]